MWFFFRALSGRCFVPAQCLGLGGMGSGRRAEEPGHGPVRGGGCMGEAEALPGGIRGRRQAEAQQGMSGNKGRAGQSACLPGAEAEPQRPLDSSAVSGGGSLH